MSTLTNPKRGEIWQVDFEPTRGEEIRKSRPAVTISRDDIGRLRLRIVLPITEWQPHFVNYSWMVRLAPDSVNGLVKVSAADTFQIRSVALDRLVEPLGSISESAADEIAGTIANCVGHKPPKSLV